jgi:hypothetical protein
MVAALMWINAPTAFPSYVGPLSSHTHGSDFSWLIGIVIGAGLYWGSQRAGYGTRVKPRRRQ